MVTVATTSARTEHVSRRPINWATVRYERTDKEKLEQLRSPQLGVVRVQSVLGAANSPGELGAQHDEQQQASHLQTKTRQHDIHTGIECALCLGSAGEPSSSGLEDEREGVGTDEGDSICAWTEAGDMVTKDDDNTAKAEVDCSSNEGRADGQGDNVPGRRISQGRFN